VRFRAYAGPSKLSDADVAQLLALKMLAELAESFSLDLAGDFCNPSVSPGMLMGCLVNVVACHANRAGRGRLPAPSFAK
jgi:hypothetical protein